MKIHTLSLVAAILTATLAVGLGLQAFEFTQQETPSDALTVIRPTKPDKTGSVKLKITPIDSRSKLPIQGASVEVSVGITAGMSAKEKAEAIQQQTALQIEENAKASQAMSAVSGGSRAISVESNSPKVGKIKIVVTEDNTSEDLDWEYFTDWSGTTLTPEGIVSPGDDGLRFTGGQVTSSAPGAFVVVETITFTLTGDITGVRPDGSPGYVRFRVNDKEVVTGFLPGDTKAGVLQRLGDQLNPLSDVETLVVGNSLEVYLAKPLEGAGHGVFDSTLGIKVEN